MSDDERPAPPDFDRVACPTPLTDGDRVQLAHGGGGRLMHRLLDEVFFPAFGPGPGAPDDRHDSAVLPPSGGRLAFTTDGYVVRPRFFPGGDIGRLAVFGTVNDLAVAGARPLWLSAGFILEEGLPLDELRRIVASMRAAADEAGVAIVTGDTKVVDRGKGDGVFIHTAGVGRVAEGVDVRPSRVRPGDAVIVSGDVGRHGVAVLSVREGLRFETPIESDCAPLAGVAAALLAPGVDVHCMRDLTRGGLAAALCEIGAAARVDIEIDETALPVEPAVAGACELLGLDAIHIANEGRLVAFVPEAEAAAALARIRTCPVGARAACIGRVFDDGRGHVLLRSALGVRRLLELPQGEQLPRIC